MYIWIRDFARMTQLSFIMLWIVGAVTVLQLPLVERYKDAFPMTNLRLSLLVQDDGDAVEAARMIMDSPGLDKW